MLKEGTWATEVEIFATAHLLNVDIYTYSGGCWLRFSVSQIETGKQSRTEAIYLNHHQLNHYNVVLSVTGEELDLTPMQQYKNPKEYKKTIPQPHTYETKETIDNRNTMKFMW